MAPYDCKQNVPFAAPAKDKPEAISAPPPPPAANESSAPDPPSDKFGKYLQYNIYCQ